MSFPNKKYKIIYADPPWKYGNFISKGRFRPHFSDGRYRTDSRFGLTPYDQMELEEIKTMPVQDITDKNSVLLLWTTMPCIPWALEIIKTWGFEYKTVAFTWVKKNPNGVGWYMGMGNYTRANAEICMLAKKGNGCKVLDRSIKQIIDLPISKHSKKPDEVRRRIIGLFGDMPRIELFARTKVFGWDTWGNDPNLSNSPLEQYIGQAVNSKLS